MTTLYEKKISAAGKVTYKEYQPEMNDREITGHQALSLAALLTQNLLDNYIKLVPSHKRSARDMIKVVDALAHLVRNIECPDEEFASHIADCWNLAFMLMSKGAK